MPVQKCAGELYDRRLHLDKMILRKSMASEHAEQQAVIVIPNRGRARWANVLRVSTMVRREVRSKLPLVGSAKARTDSLPVSAT